MAKVSILVDEKEKLCDNVVNIIKEFMFNNSVEEVQINKQMADNYYDIVVDLLGGENYEGNILLKNGVPFGTLRMVVRNKVEPIDISILNRACKKVDLTILDGVIARSRGIKYLIMSNNTFSMLVRASSVSSVENDPSIHFYKNIPIALTEYLNPGIIDVIVN